MVTEFGKFLRKLRIDKGELLGQMAEKMGYTSAYLSAIELGKRAIPKGFVDSLGQAYGLEEGVIEELREAAEISATNIKIDLQGKGPKARKAAVVFAREFDDLDDETAEEFLKFLRKRTGE